MGMKWNIERSITAPLGEHGNFQYTLRQFLLLRKHHEGGDWTDTMNAVGSEFHQNPEWDPDWLDTYDNWLSWYYGQGGNPAARPEYVGADGDREERAS